MKKRSPSYPSKHLTPVKDFIINVYDSVGDGSTLTYKQLAEYGNVPVREVDTFTSTAIQYGWMNSVYGKGYAINSAVCKILRKPLGTEEQDEFFKAFMKPAIYGNIIRDFNNKQVQPAGLEIYLTRDPHNFTDVGATLCAKIFIENAKAVGRMNSDNLLDIETELVPIPIEEKSKKAITKNQNIKKPDPIKAVKKDPKINTIQEEQNTEYGQPTLSLFVRGKELKFNVLHDMKQADWDSIIKQIQNIKQFSK